MRKRNHPKDKGGHERPSVLIMQTMPNGMGVEFLRLACVADLEGVAAKLKHGASGDRFKTRKIRNSRYSQYEGGGGCLKATAGEV